MDKSIKNGTSTRFLRPSRMPRPIKLLNSKLVRDHKLVSMLSEHNGGNSLSLKVDIYPMPSTTRFSMSQETKILKHNQLSITVEMVERTRDGRSSMSIKLEMMRLRD